MDLFCGIGGLSHGFIQEGFLVDAGIDSDPACKFAYEANNSSTFIHADVAELSAARLETLFTRKRKILIGCAPCQPFSSYTFKEKNKNKDKWGLLYHFARLIRETVPELVSMENVPQLRNFKEAAVLDDFVEELKQSGYHVFQEVVRCADYGIPQRRKRLVVLASRLGPIELLPPTHTAENYKTVRDAIGWLEPICDGESHPADELHFARKLSPLNQERIRHTPYGGSWKNWPEKLILDCHRKKSGKSYTAVYGRMKWEEPAPTITTHCIGYGNGRFGHPEQDRAISLREAALLQTFPPEYRLIDPEKQLQSVIIAKQLGNAVPVQLGRVIAGSIKKHLELYARS